jgi:hypothetical protein
MRSLARRACSLVVVLTLLVAGAVPTAVRRGCPLCPPECPMHAGKVGCHHGSGPGCHHRSDSPGLRAACAAGEPVASLGTPGFRSILPGRVAVSAPLVVAAALAEPARALRDLPLEPPTEPPRARPV